METSEKKVLLDMIQGFNTIDFITPETVPDIDIYMDQITTFMDTHSLCTVCSRLVLLQG